jgi:hypothetical protein
VIGHQCVCVKGAIVFDQGFFQPMQIAEIVLLSKEARLAIVAALGRKDEILQLHIELERRRLQKRGMVK